jgi:phytoene desaturase
VGDGRTVEDASKRSGGSLGFESKSGSKFGLYNQLAGNSAAEAMRCVAVARRLKVAVVGAGVGGLAAAARLAHAGFDVHVFEKQPGPGGRCGQLRLSGFTFDIGPTILLMPEVLRRTFEAVGKKLEDYLVLERCHPNYKVHFHDGTRLTLGSDMEALCLDLERLVPGSSLGFLSFLALSGRMYHTSLERFVLRNFDGPAQFLSPSNLAQLLRLRAFRSLASVVRGFVQDSRLQAALTFQTMYLGMSPYEAPAVYGLLPYSEMGVGVYFARGGLYSLPLALEQLAMEQGARFHYCAEVRRILSSPTNVHGLELQDGMRVEADLVLCNADLPWAYRTLLDASHTRLARAGQLRYTSSGYILYLGVGHPVAGLGHHSVFLGKGYRDSFEDIFHRHRVPEDPSFYVAVPNRSDASLAPAGKDSVYALVPVPHRHPGIDWAQEGPRLRAKVLSRLAREGYPLEPDIEVERAATPDDWETSFHLENGSAFGLSMDLRQIGPFRPSNQDPRLRNLFFVGASTAPGTGLPTVMVSAELVVERMRTYAASLGVPLRSAASPPQGQAA